MRKNRIYEVSCCDSPILTVKSQGSIFQHERKYISNLSVDPEDPEYFPNAQFAGWSISLTIHDHLLDIQVLARSRNSSVGIATGYRLDD
jgi:hypothetical protein